jgi:DNA adenine methylase
MDADQGHYRGYSENDFIQLLDVLSKIKGKFLLSCYPSDLVNEYIGKCGWHHKSVEKVITASIVNASGKREKKTELLIANYPIE